MYPFNSSFKTAYTNCCLIFTSVFLAILICDWVGFDIVAVVVVLFCLVEKKLLLVSQFSFDDTFLLTGRLFNGYCVIVFMIMIAAWRCLLAVDMTWGLYNIHLIVLVNDVGWLKMFCWHYSTASILSQVK